MHAFFLLRLALPMVENWIPWHAEWVPALGLAVDDLSGDPGLGDATLHGGPVIGVVAGLGESLRDLVGPGLLSFEEDQVGGSADAEGAAIALVDEGGGVGAEEGYDAGEG